MSSQPTISQFRMTFSVIEYIPSFHLPVDFPHKMQIEQALQGWFEDVDYVIVIELCWKNTHRIFFAVIKKLLMKQVGANWFVLPFWSNRCYYWRSVLILEVLKHVEASGHVLKTFQNLSAAYPKVLCCTSTITVSSVICTSLGSFLQSTAQCQSLSQLLNFSPILNHPVLQ